MEGTCERIIEGDELGKHIGEPTGHVKMIIVGFYGNRIFSGSMDNTIIVWRSGNRICKKNDIIRHSLCN